MGAAQEPPKTAQLPLRVTPLLTLTAGSSASRHLKDTSYLFVCLFVSQLLGFLFFSLLNPWPCQ